LLKDLCEKSVVLVVANMSLFLRATAVPAGTAEARISYGNSVCLSVCPTVCHDPVQKQPSGIETPGLHHMIA